MTIKEIKTTIHTCDRCKRDYSIEVQSPHGYREVIRNLRYSTDQGIGGASHEDKNLCCNCTDAFKEFLSNQ